MSDPLRSAGARRLELISEACHKACILLMYLVDVNKDDKATREGFGTTLDCLLKLGISGFDLIVNDSERWLIGFNKPNGSFVFDTEVHLSAPLMHPEIDLPFTSSKFTPRDLDEMIAQLRNPPPPMHN